MKNPLPRLIPFAFALLAGGIVTFPLWKQGQTPVKTKPGEMVDAERGKTVSPTATDNRLRQNSVSDAIGVELSEALSPSASLALWRERPEVLRSEKVELPGFMNGTPIGAKLLLPLPGGERVEVARWFESRYASGQFSISGEIADGENGLFSMARSGDAISGVISSPSAAYQYRGTVGGSFVVAEIDRSALAECSGCFEPNPTEEQLAAASERAGDTNITDQFPEGDIPEAAEGDTETIDILFVYTDDVARRFGGTSGAEADILSTIGLSNQRFQSSSADTRLRITSMREIEYEETGDAGEDLDALTYIDGVIDQVQDLRDVDGADLVAMSVSNMEFFAGLAWLGGEARDSEFAIYSVTLHSQLDFAFTHEIGHNLGCAHDRENAGGAGFRNYSFGYRYVGASGRTNRTLMAYAPGIRMDRFSNPDIEFDGRPTGSSSEDNVRTIRETSQNVAAFRERIVASGDGPVINQITVTENPTGSSNTFDGQIQPGEDVRISFDVINPFDIALTGVRMSVSATDEFIEVLDPGGSIPDLPAGGSVSVSDAVRLRISGETPVNAEALLITAFTSDQGTWATTAAVTVFPRPIELQIASFVINDRNGGGLSGNDNGIAEPGEEFNFQLNVVNRGSATMRGSQGTMQFGDECLSLKFGDDGISFQSIAPGATGISNTFRVIADDCPRGTRVSVRADVTSDTGSYTFEKVLVLGTLELGAADIPVTVAGNTPVREGERLRISPRVKNTGDAVATEVTGSIVELDPGLALESDIPLEFGSIVPGVEVGPSQAKAMRVTRYAPVGSLVGFQIEYESEGETWVIPYSLAVEPPVTPPVPPQIALPSGDGSLNVTLPQTHNGMEYALEWSADMASWESLGGAVIGTGEALSMDPQIPETAEGDSKIFIRVVRVQPDPA